MKTLIKACVLGVVIGCLVPSFVFSASKANPRKGKYLYRKNCLGCHKFGSENQLGPNSKTQAEWQAVFTKENLATLKCNGNLKSLSDKDMNDIHAHMKAHASDSPAPAACR